MSKWRFRMLCAVCLLSACEMNDFSDEEQEENIEVVVPQGHGEGTQAKPYTPSSLLRGGDLPYGEPVWVMGYAVGSTIESMENALFDVPTEYEHNILLSNDPQCSDPADCIAVELSGSEMQLRYSLAFQPGSFQRFIVIRGTLGSYFKQVGIRKTDAAYWIDDFDLIRICPPRQEWDVVDKDF